MKPTVLVIGNPGDWSLAEVGKELDASSVFDFVIRPGGAQGEWIALEANAAGAWGWLADECGLPIAAAFADTLTKD